jgi:hypothetical protein
MLIAAMKLIFLGHTFLESQSFTLQFVTLFVLRKLSFFSSRDVTIINISNCLQSIQEWMMRESSLQERTQQCSVHVLSKTKEMNRNHRMI